MGLETLGMSCFEGAMTTICIPKTSKGWLHGLTPDEVRVVERHYNRSFSNPDHDSFWAQESFDIPHTGLQLDLDYPPDLLKLSVAKVIGYVTSDPSVQHNYWFVVYDEAKEESLKAKLYENKAKANAILEKLRSEDSVYMIALARKISGYAKSIVTAQGAFVTLYEYIEGEHAKNKAVNIQVFLDSVDPSLGGKVPKQRTIIEGAVRTAIQINVIRYDVNRVVYYNAALPESNYGRSEEEVVNFLLNEGNAHHLGTGGEQDQPFAILRQIGASYG